MGSKKFRVDPSYVTILRSVFLGKLLNFYVNDNKMVPVFSVVTNIALVLSFKICCTYISWSINFKIFLVSFLDTFLFPEIIISANRFLFIVKDHTN